MRALITGASGMLGAALVKKWQNKFEVFATDKKNFTNSPAKNFMPFDLLSNSYDELMQWAKPDIIIHCAAITNVDYCEENPKQAMAVNADSVKKFLKYGSDSRLIFISSDAVFPDEIHMASEKDQTSPENVYGQTKEIGEKYIEESMGSHVVIRTTIVGKNINPLNQGFVEWIVNSVKSGKDIKLFDDAIFTPISIWDLAKEIEWIMKSDISGVFHLVGETPISKYDFGKKICERLGLDTKLIKKGSINDIVFKAKRSKDQTMDSIHYQFISKRSLPIISETIHLIVNYFEVVDYA